MSKDTKIKDTIRVVADYLNDDLKNSILQKAVLNHNGQYQYLENIYIFADEVCIEPCIFI